MTLAISETALFVAQWVELSILLKASMVLVMGLVIARLAYKVRASVRHLIMVATFGTLIVLPLIMLTTPQMTIDVPVARETQSSLATTANGTSQPLVSSQQSNLSKSSVSSSRATLPSASSILRTAWLGGAFILLSSLAISMIRLRRLCRSGLPWPESTTLISSIAREHGLRSDVQVLLHEGIPAPLTCGVFRPIVLLPKGAESWSESRLTSALIHELEHVRRGDWLVQIGARATCAFYWFHPLVWMAWRRLCLEAERACDDAVVQESERTDYAEQLVLLAQQMSVGNAYPALGMANRSDLSRRVSAVLDEDQRRGRVGLPVAATAVCAALVIVVAIAPVRAVPRVNTAAGSAQQDSHAGTLSKSSEVSAIDRALLEAAEEGDITSVSKLLDSGANVNCAIDGDGSPLIVASRSGLEEMVRLLLGRGADPNMAVPGDGNPLIMAAREGHIEIVQLLLDRGALIDQIVPGDENALILASGNGQFDVVKLLINRGANVNAGVWEDDGLTGKREWRSPLNMARKGRHTDVVNLLISNGAR